MIEEKKSIKWLVVRCLLFILLIVVAFTIRKVLEKRTVENAQDTVQQVERKTEYAPAVSANNFLLGEFKAEFISAEILLACEEDVTADGLMDLVVIMRLDGHIRTVVMIDQGDGENYHYSQPIKAPVENQKIQFKNIDKEGQNEIIITGEKNGAVGYAIYRMIDGEPVDLFGEGMEDCC